MGPSLASSRIAGASRRGLSLVGLILALGVLALALPIGAPVSFSSRLAFLNGIDREG